MIMNRVNGITPANLRVSISVPQGWVPFETGDDADIIAFSSGEASELSQVAVMLCRDHGETPVKNAKAYALGYALAIEGDLSQFTLRRAFGYKEHYRISYRWEGEGRGTVVECIVAFTEGQVIMGEVRFEDGSEERWSSIIEEMFAQFSVCVNAANMLKPKE